MSFENIQYFKPPELRHYGKRAEIYALDEEKSVLNKIAWKLSHGKEFTEKERRKAIQALERIARIPKLDNTCINQDCEKCSKLVDKLGQKGERKPWRLNLELYRWQKECEKEWKGNGGEGIVKVVTGAGKTILALSLIEYIKEKYRDNSLKITIVVPTSALLDQWLEELKDNLNIGGERIGTYYTEKKDDIQEKQVMIYVINSAREQLVKDVKRADSDIFLIVDECHRAGSEKNSNIFETAYDYTLGLSATPERKSDYAFEEILTKNLGDIIYDYSYSDARNDGIIPSYRLKRIAVPLTEKEYEHYEKYSDKLKKISKVLFSRYPELEEVGGDEFFKKLGELKKIHDDNLIKKYTTISNQRKSIIHESKSKLSCLKHLIKNKIDTRARILIFHERTKIADDINEYLRENNLNSTVYHTGISPGERRKNLTKYRNGDKNILATCKALDEGLDVPDTSVGIIAAATSSVRQRIQRIGRILRKSPGKDYSEIYTIYVRELEERIFEKEDIKDLEESADRIERIEMEFT